MQTSKTRSNQSTSTFEKLQILALDKCQLEHLKGGGDIIIEEVVLG